MYTVIYKYDLYPETKEVLIQEARVGLIPLLNEIPGFRVIEFLEVDDNEVVVISSFNTLADAKASARLTGKWFNGHVEEYIKGFAKLAEGTVIEQATNNGDLLRGVF